MLTTGVDIIEIPRIKQVLDRYGQRFLNRVFTPDEIAYCRGRAPNLAGRFAAKEAAMKALGTGVRGVSWKDIEVIRADSGAPSLRLHGRAEKRAERLQMSEMSLSISHSREYAVAFVVAQREETP
ncbi:MAG: holo-[acyl-carrier-protein] synthase [SAR202 cluster bacterium]|jgi:holo-[acyl-carrier protein] synthase|nr:holo-ACP synthase [Dehalococcoidia bacterium]MQG13855.1 holo-[acyl-carrier-protein] synthase [SAR202 cluster bacterium]MCS5667288.1 holo-ACP synthase [Dehalococcoidia bacterium]MQG31378.1 holo-[acyl-carrier-protein] synthase [SAR202 cluster bacterium]MQG42476.1 holo-[acyl-carrier-protein] synthase [SAR202 cluster bacterium]|tara:strand:- start:1576 stop:1950 length:375 start_codon:yes stop_codon:yes gene_type:complete